MRQTTWQARAGIGVVLIYTGILLDSVNLGGGLGEGYVYVLLGAGFLSSAYWKKTHLGKEVVIEREQQRKRKFEADKLRRKINKVEIDQSIETLDPTFTSIPTSDNHGDGHLYSEILQNDVLRCCYQSARLNDKYCVCGRALEYPSQN